ncbi:preprotein translocase subunit SecA [uncultured Desulfobacter sp.]|uniref:preprotein translocase subunit SecA n=1 Tax=uncultured Desulfobacter sp. TaxID=240139 RepID=UPI0029F48B6C|nr:preprotein translocase subunit SecA [uncultured Desulfobacter sp.]
MKYPSYFYTTQHIPVPEKLHQGTDGLIYGLIGALARRFEFTKNLESDAMKIHDRAIALRQVKNSQLKDKIQTFKDLFQTTKHPPWENVKEAMALLVEIGDRSLGMRAFPVQIMGAMVMYKGGLAEMSTGEGKTFAAVFPAILNAWTQRPCHIVTVNDYLAHRDTTLMGPMFNACGIQTGFVTGDMDQKQRRKNYTGNVVYTTSKELTADFLRDRLMLGRFHHPSRQLLRSLMDPVGVERDKPVMRGLHTVIVDEADSVLIDEAVTPLIISKPKENKPLVDACLCADAIGDQLEPGEDFFVVDKYKEVKITPQGFEKINNLTQSLDGIWKGAPRRTELIEQALKARHFYTRDKQYIVQDDKIMIVDEFTGRIMPNRTWRQGMHQAVEAKEGVTITHPSETISRLSFQRFFRFFTKISGMTGTAREAAAEFWHIYGLKVQPIPTNRPCIRNKLPPAVFLTENEKWTQIARAVAQCHKTLRPILIGTKNVKDSEHLADILREQHYDFNLLNAVNHKEEAAIIARAGTPGMITIATNMAGRGTDIKLGNGVSELGGLHVIATECNDSSRIDRQLFGRCARQGDPGSVQAFASIEDELIQRFVPPKIQKVLISKRDKHSALSIFFGKRITEYAQKKAQKQAFEQRKNVLKKDSWLEEALSFSGE